MYSLRNHHWFCDKHWISDKLQENFLVPVFILERKKAVILVTFRESFNHKNLKRQYSQD